MEQESLLEKEHLSQIVASDVKYNKDSFRRLFLSEDLQTHLFKLFDQDNDGNLVQDDWIEFLKIRLLDEDINFCEHLKMVAYRCCGADPITIDRFSKIFKTKGIIENIYKLVDRTNSKSVTSKQVMDFLDRVTTARPYTGFDKERIKLLEDIFRKTVGKDNEIKKVDFMKIINSKNPVFSEKVFNIFDEDHSGSISLQEFLDTMYQFSAPEDKVKFIFEVYDLDGDGLIQRKELEKVMKECIKEGNIMFRDHMGILTSALIEGADTNNTDGITFDAFKNQLEKYEGLLENLSMSIESWLLPSKPKPPITLKEKIKQAIPYQLTMPYMKNNYEFVIFQVCIIAMNLALFISRILEYKNESQFYMLARACGQCLNFNCAFALVLVLRYSINYLRSKGFAIILPIDRHLYFHKQTGYLVMFYSVFHTIMHCFYLDEILKKYSLSNHNDTQECSDTHNETCTAIDYLFTTKPGGKGLLPGFAYPTGILLVIIVTVIFMCSQPFVRRRGNFQAFYWSHTLYVPFWILVILHCKYFWLWFIVPGTIFAIETVMRFLWAMNGKNNTYITSGLLSGEVIALQIQRPLNFLFNPGDYIFVKIPEIAQYEWHPFTISSPPEQEDSISLHIKAVGDWTKQLQKILSDEQKKIKTLEFLEKPKTYSSSKPKNATKRFQATARTVLSTKCDTLVMDKDNTSTELMPTIRSETEKQDPSSSIETQPASSVLLTTDAQKKNNDVTNNTMNLESRKSFDDSQSEEDKLGSLCNKYLNEHNTSLAQNFKYMRNKPIIVVFKTPESKASDCGSSPEKEAEEGRMMHLLQIPKDATSNYPVAKPFPIMIDGPYGTPTSHIFRAEHAVLIATGIGLTPASSILQSIMFRYWKARQTCPKCKYSFSSSIPQTVMNLKKVDFIWINKDEESFDWFIQLMSKLEIEQAELRSGMERFLDMHIYLTKACGKNDMQAVSLRLALDLLHEKEKRDLITGLKKGIKTQRPVWEEVFDQIQSQNKGKVTVFFCGNKSLANELKVQSGSFVNFNLDCKEWRSETSLYTRYSEE